MPRALLELCLAGEEAVAVLTAAVQQLARKLRCALEEAAAARGAEAALRGERDELQAALLAQVSGVGSRCCQGVHYMLPFSSLSAGSTFVVQARTGALAHACHAVTESAAALHSPHCMSACGCHRLMLWLVDWPCC